MDINMKGFIFTGFSLFIYILLAAILVFPVVIYAQEIKPIKLLKPQTEGGRPLMQVLKERKSTREFSSQELPLQVISNMLWAAFGINRPDQGRRTAPSASNAQEIDIYVAKQDGLYLYNAKKNMLVPVAAGDIRVLTGKQLFVQYAPINLIYVADLSKLSIILPPDRSKMGKTPSPEYINLYAATDTGFISQNVYLFCASEGLATVVRGWVDRSVLAKAMKLRSDQKIILTQTVGYPKK